MSYSGVATGSTPLATDCLLLIKIGPSSILSSYNVHNIFIASALPNIEVIACMPHKQTLRMHFKMLFSGNKFIYTCLSQYLILIGI